MGRDEARAAKCQQLREHSRKVTETVEWKKEDESIKARHKAEWLQQMMKKSDIHREACRVAYEQRMDERHQIVHEREHEVSRVARMNDYMQKQRITEYEEDMTIFKECMRMQVSIPHQVSAKLAKDLASNLS